jgi:ACT domain-containing protein
MINLEVKLPDTPGSLIELIKPISKNGGNIYGILHYHDKVVNNMIPVTISFELSEEIREISLQNIKSELKEKNIQIENITYGVARKALTIILTGHVFDTDVLDTIKRLATKNIVVSELTAKFTELNEVSNVKLKIEFPESLSKNYLLEELNKICEEKNLFLITS